MTDRRHQLLNAALAYAEAGWPVFPLRPGTKRPAAPNHSIEHCDGSDYRCRNGHVGWEARATTDPDRISRAWHQRPYGIGIACGPAGLIVVDLDTAKGTALSGAESLAQLEDDYGQALPTTWTVRTPSGGRHLYYLIPPAARLGNTVGRLGPGIDTRSQGGYVVAPPTQITDGDYWLLDDHAPVELPPWFSQLLNPPARAPHQRRASIARAETCLRGDRARGYVAAAVASEERRIANASEGQRNHTLFTASIAVGQLVGAQAIDESEAEQLLIAASQPHVAAGAYSAGQARQTIASGLRRGTAEPRRLPSQLTTERANR